MRATERQRGSGHSRPAWPGNAASGQLRRLRVRCERPSASEGAASSLRGRAWRAASVCDASDRAPARERPQRPAWPGNAASGQRAASACDASDRAPARERPQRPAWPGNAAMVSYAAPCDASDRAPARERPQPACVAGNAANGQLRRLRVRCERPSASEGAATVGLRGRGTQPMVSARAGAQRRLQPPPRAMRATERQRGSGHNRPAWPGNAANRQRPSTARSAGSSSAWPNS